jgi:hypothetical protein
VLAACCSCMKWLSASKLLFQTDSRFSLGVALAVRNSIVLHLPGAQGRGGLFNRPPARQGRAFVMGPTPAAPVTTTPAPYPFYGYPNSPADPMSSPGYVVAAAAAPPSYFAESTINGPPKYEDVVPAGSTLPTYPTHPTYLAYHAGTYPSGSAGPAGLASPVGRADQGLFAATTASAPQQSPGVGAPASPDVAGNGAASSEARADPSSPTQGLQRAALGLPPGDATC